MREPERNAAARPPLNELTAPIGGVSPIGAPRDAGANYRALFDRGDELLRAATPEQAARALAELVVPAVADCALVVLHDASGAPQLAALAHREPHVVAEHEEAVRAYVTESAEVALLSGDAGLALLRRLGVSSPIVVPIAGRGAPLGHFAIACATTDHLSDDTHRVVQSLGQRAGLVLEQLELLGRLRTSQELLRSVIDTTPDIVFAKDLAGRYELLNHAGAQVMGMDPRDVVGCTDEDLFGPEDAARIRREDLAVMSANEAQAFREELEMRGRLHVFQTARLPRRAVDGSVLGVVGVTRDLTQQHEAEEALRRHTAALNAFFDAPGIDMCIFDLLPDDSDFVYTLPNPRMAQFWGRTPAELAGCTGRDIGFPEHQIAEWVAYFRECQRRGAMGFEYSIDHHDQPRTWHYAAMQAVELEPGCTSICFIATDITERKRAEEEVRQSAEGYRLVTDGLPVLIAYIDVDQRYRFVNAEYERLYGLSRDRFLGRSVEEVMGASSYLTLRPHVQRALSGEEVRFEADVALPDGRVRRMAASYVPSRDARGASRGFFVMAADVTERHSLEEQLRQSQKMEAIGRLAGGIAHDFNNLLTVISAATEFAIASAAAGSDPTAELEEVSRASARAAELTRQLLAFSRKQVARRQVLGLNEVVREAEKMLRRTIGEHVALRLDLAADESWAEVDRVHLEQALVNLVVNARDAMPEGGTVTIATARRHLSSIVGDDLEDGEYAELSVSDNGMGMDELTRRRVFEPFFTTKEIGKGTGLGLSTVYGIVRQHGGTATVDSAPGRGTTFNLYLPVVAHDATPSAPAVLVMPRGGHERLLLVEDETSVRMLMRRALEREGYAVTEASSGMAALALLGDDATAPDLVVTDVVMPGMSGKAMVDTLRARFPGLAVIFVSGYSTEELEERTTHGEGGVAAANGAPTAVLAKPFAVPELLRRVREMLDARVPR